VDLNAEELVPDVIGGYRVLGRIARGLTSNVYRVRRAGGTGFHRDFALKILDQGAADRRDCSRAFVDEATVASHLHHRNLVAVHEFGQLGGRWYAVMDLVEGLDLLLLLRNLQRRGRWLPQSAAVEVAVQVLQGLHHAHVRVDERGRELGIVHRDVNPTNVLISQHGCVRLTDWGLARIQDNTLRTESGVEEGSPRFLSPEQARNEPLDGRSDQFAVGVLLYFMLSRELPFSGDSDDAVRDAVIACRHRPLAEVAPQVAGPLLDLVGTLLAPDRRDRFATCFEAADELAWTGYEEVHRGHGERLLAEVVESVLEPPAVGRVEAITRP